MKRNKPDRWKFKTRLGHKALDISKRISYLCVGILISFGVSLNTAKAQEPAGCSGSGLGIALFASTEVAHIGDTVTYSATVFNEDFPACRASSINASITTPDGEVHEIELDRTTLEPGESDFYEDVVSYQIREQDLVPGEEEKRRFASATAQTRGDIHQNETLSEGGGQQQVNTIVRRPCINVTLECVPGEGESAQIQYTGTVSNCGDAVLVDVDVVHSVGGTQTTLLEGISLEVGESRELSGSYTPAQPCEPSTSEVVATGRDTLPNPLSVEDSASATCQLTLNPGIDVEVQCPTSPAAPGADLTYTGTVTNTGNVTLSNVEVVSNQPSSGTSVLTLDTLAPGESTSFSGSLPVAQACEVSTRVNASAQSVCGTNVQASSSVNCPIETTPSIVITKNCPDEIVPGERFTFEGTVENTGNITLRNVRISSDFPSDGDRVFEVGRLEPGEVFEYSHRERAPQDACEVSDTTTVTGVDICSGEEVGDSVDTSCLVQINPAIEVTQNCPSNPTNPGEPVNFSGTVRNTGDVTLQNVTVMSERPSPQTELITIESLAPGQSRSYSGSFPAPSNACTVENTVTAQGTSACGDRNVFDEATTECPIRGNPDIEVTAECPDEPVLPGHELNVTGTVSNTGDVPLNDVVVVNQFSGETTEVFGPDQLAPGETASFTTTVTVPEGINDCTVSTQFQAEGTGDCNDQTVTASASTECALLTRPSIRVTSQCPEDPVEQGSRLRYTGTVENTGNITLKNVRVFSEREHPDGGNRVANVVTTLEPGQTHEFSGRYRVPDDCCDVQNTLRAEGVDICTEEKVEDQSTTRCPVLFEPQLEITKECPEDEVAPGETLTYTGTVENTGNITMEDVVVYSDVPGRDAPFVGPINLAPGETISYMGSYTVPTGFCGSDTVTVEGASICGDKTAQDSVTSTCPVDTTPKLTVINNCPTGPVSPGDEATFTGSLVNDGDVTLTDVVVSHSFVAGDAGASPEEDVFGPVSIEPGETVSFDYTITVPAEEKCCEIVNTLNASGGTACGETVSSSSTAVCPVTTQPNINVTVECVEGPLDVGAWVEYFGVVENTGDITLENVVVTATRDGSEEQLVGPITLAVGETQDFHASYVKSEQGPLASFVVTGAGNDVCSGQAVEGSASCNTTGPASAGSLVVDSISRSQGTVELQWGATAGHTYTVEACPSLDQGEWQVLESGVKASGGTVTWSHETNGEKSLFFRVRED